jgi:hypothetical protein
MIYSMKQLLSIIFLLLISSQLLAKSYPLKKGQWYLNNKLSYLNTLANFEEDLGSFVKLDNNNSFNYTKYSAAGRYDFSKKMALLTQIDIVKSESTNSSFVRDNSGISDIHFGVLSHFNKWGFTFYPEALITIPVATLDTGTDQPLLSEGVIALMGGVTAYYESKHFSPFISTKINYRDKDLATLLHLNFGSEIYTGNFQFSLVAEYYTTIVDDSNVNTPRVRTDLTTLVNASSLIFHSVNPALLELAAGLSYDLNKKMSLGFKYKTSLDGQNSAFSDTYLINFKWRGLTYSKRKVHKKKRSKMLKEFEEEIEDLKQDIRNPDSV